MNTFKPNFRYLLGCMTLCLSMTLFMSNNIYAQNENPNEVSVYQYRYVSPDKVEEFIKRETTYWSAVAKKAMEKGNLTFWALLQKVGGTNIPNTPNFLFINTFQNIDDMAGTWDAEAVFPKIPMEDMSTWDMSTNMHTLFVQSQNWSEKEGVKRLEDFKYIKYTYHSSNASWRYVNLEKEYWQPMVQKAMNEGKTPQTAWGNGVVLSPLNAAFTVNSVSYDLYPSLTSALTGRFDESVEFPTELFDKLDSLTTNPRTQFVYKILKVESATPPKE